MPDRFLLPFRAWRLRRARYKAGVLMAKATYEPLDQEEQSDLDHLLRDYPLLSAEQEKYVSFAKNFQIAPDNYNVDLSTRIRAALEAPSFEVKRHRWATTYAAAAAVVLLSLALYAGVMLLENGSANESRLHNAGVAELNSETVASLQETDTSYAVLAAARDLVSSNDLMRAATLLEEYVEANPHAPGTSEALLQLADIEYTCLQRYDRAFMAYDKVYANFPEAFEHSADCWMRYGLLAESQKEGFAPLYALESARKGTGDTFNTYENIAALYPTTMLANEALDEMRMLMKCARQHGEASAADELERVRAHCSDPVAMALVDLTLGYIYSQSNERECAEASYKSVAAGGHIALANQAYLALQNME